MNKPIFLNRQSPPHIATLTLLAGLSALTLNIFLPSLPRMAEWFGVPYATMQLSVSLYLALSAVLQIIVGPISDRIGRRPVLIWSLAVFLLATVGTLVAPTAETFLICRMAQAVIASGMVLSRAVVRDMVPGAQAASMIGYVTMGMSMVPMVGPLIGGALDELFDWQANFAVLLVLGLSVTALVWADLGETATRRRLPLSVLHAQYWELLGSRRFWAYVGGAAFAAGAYYVFLGGAAYVGTQIYGLGSFALGVYFAALAVGYAVGNFIAGRYSVRYGMDPMAQAGAWVTVAGMAVLALCGVLGLHAAPLFFGMSVVVGMGNGMTLPNANAGMMSVRADLAGSASGLGGALMLGGGAALSSLAAWMMEGATRDMALVWLMLGCAVLSALFLRMAAATTPPA
ncbi:MAG: Bcr/CflA family efflux MFS transporter [Rhodobacteraceae bacterium]|nr:Bcr/CflA family efflux MFS transporter [Paracoccaceae bacterium]